jgi:hypothetical protein
MIAALRMSVVLALTAVAACDRASAPDPTLAETAPQAANASSTPRYADGMVRLDRAPGHRGYWGNASLASLIERGVAVEMDAAGRLTNLEDASRVAPFRPWALALYRYRQSNGLKDDPVQYCLPPAGPRHLQDRRGFRIIQDRNYGRIYFLFGGGNRNWRLIHMDGREPPNPDEVVGTYYGHSTGDWQGDTLVVESSGFNARFWFSQGGLPHTEALHLTERVSRPTYGTLHYEVTIDDPLTYTRPWTAAWDLDWIEGAEIREHFCEDARAASTAPGDDGYVPR